MRVLKIDNKCRYSNVADKRTESRNFHAGMVEKEIKTPRGGGGGWKVRHLASEMREPISLFNFFPT